MYAGTMRKIADIHTFEDESFLKTVTCLSVAALVAGLLVALAVALGVAMCAPQLFDPELTAMFDEGGFLRFLAWLVGVSTATMLSLGVHELVHAVFFKAYAPAGAHVTFGANWKLGMLYACAEGIVYTRRQYLVIALAPSIAVTALCLVLGFVLGHPVAGSFVAVLHLSGCSGDWAYVREITGDPAITHCEDTDYGVCFYGEDACGEGDGGKVDA